MFTIITFRKKVQKRNACFFLELFGQEQKFGT